MLPPTHTTTTTTPHPHTPTHLPGPPPLCCPQEFPSGITNGAQWYPLYGGMQDWSYLAAGCMELTIESNFRKYPGPEHLPSIWAQNEPPLMEWALIAAYGGE